MNLLFDLVKTWSKIQGISADLFLIFTDTKAYDGIVRVTSDDALAPDGKLGERRLLVGISSAAAIYGAIEICQKILQVKKSLFQHQITVNVISTAPL